MPSIYIIVKIINFEESKGLKFDPPVVQDGRQVQQQERHTVNLNHRDHN